MERPIHLPDFEVPPLIEVAISLQFNEIEGFGPVDLGLLWERFQPSFKLVEYHPPLAPTFETFGLAQPSGRMDINLSAVPPLPRTWFTTLARNEVIQIQSDRFVHNWRKIGEGSEYPRYEHIRSKFVQELECLNGFLSERGLGPLIPNQCELTYVNSIIVPDGDGDPGFKIFRNWGFPSGQTLGEPEDVSFIARFVLLSGDGEPTGRIIAQSIPGQDPDGRSTVQLILIGRGQPSEPTVDAALKFMDQARDRIVSGFADLTTEHMHHLWGRKE